jgi:ubiquinone/menaquinone biosynthesis C-methylase UbiE
MLETLTAPRRPGLPGYDGYQHAFHEAFRPELYAALDELPLPFGGSVLDVPCGDGFYAAHLVARAGRLVAADASGAYLSLARESLADHASAEVRRADAYALPFADGTFDLVFSAQSLISLDNPAKAIREMVRVTKPRGHVAILECDQFHHVLLPLPPEQELTVQRGCRRRGCAGCGGGRSRRTVPRRSGAGKPTSCACIAIFSSTSRGSTCR